MKRRLGRRNWLRGAGVCLALPWLESLAPRGARAQQASLPKRYLPISFPCGAAAQWWEGAPPAGSGVFGAEFVLSALHAPLAALKSKLLMLSRVGNYSWNTNELDPTYAPYIHARSHAALLTCVDADQLATAANMALPSAVINGVSADQVIVQAGDLGALTPLPSLQLGLSTFAGAFDGRSWAYNQALSWKSAEEPLKRQVNPKAVFDAMVTAGAIGADDDAGEEAARRAAERKSVLDAVLEDAAELKPRLGRADQETVEQFMTAFREVEQRVPTVAAQCDGFVAPGEIPEAPGAVQGLNQGDMGYDRAAHSQVMNDLITLAFQCDVTRVITYMLDDPRSEFDYRFIPEADRVFGATGALENYHGGCQSGPGSIDLVPTNGVYPGTSNGAYAAVGRWWVRQVAELAAKLDAIPEGDGTVLDHTLIQLMSSMRSHDHSLFDLPLLLLGGTGFLKQDGHVALAAAPGDRQLRDLYYTIQTQYFGLDVASFGDGEGPNALITELLA